MNILKQAVVAVFERDGRYLATSRPNDATQWGFPGGKVEQHETTIEAVCREVHEEVGVLSSMMWWMPLHACDCTGDVDYWVTAYLWREQPIKDNELRPEPGLVLDWLTRDQLLNPAISPFAEYNAGLFQSLDRFVYRSRQQQYGA